MFCEHYLEQGEISLLAAYTSLDAKEGPASTVAIHIPPDQIPNNAISNIQRYMATICGPLAKLAEEDSKNVRQDRYTTQFISLSVTRGKYGYQWQIIDDDKSGGVDIVDHTHLIVKGLLTYGPGPFLGPKLMLGSIDGDIIR